MNTVRRANRQKIQSVFADTDILIASEIAVKTGLSVVTVNAVLEEMCAKGEIEKSGVFKGKSGRPSVSYKYNRAFRCGFIFYGYNRGDFILFKALVVNDFGEEIFTDEFEVKDITAEFVVSVIDRMKDGYPETDLFVFGFPGYQNGKVFRSADFASFMTDGFLDWISERYGCRIVFINDINAAIYGRNQINKQKYKNEVGIFFPKNFSPGAGIVIDNKVYSGTSNFAGEIAGLPAEINWEELSLHSEDEIARQVTGLLFCFSCVIAPESIVLYGEYLNNNVLEIIKKRLQGLLVESYMPNVEISADFDSDFKMGLICTLKKELGDTA